MVGADAQLRGAEKVAELFAREVKPSSQRRPKLKDDVRVQRFFGRLLELALSQEGAQPEEVRTALESLQRDTDVKELASALRLSEFFRRAQPAVVINLKEMDVELLPISRTDLFAPIKRFPAEAKSSECPSFASLLRQDPMMALGDVQGRLVEGVVLEVVDSHLYVDFGGKFLCVVPRPTKMPELYVRGTAVVLRLEELEMVSAFMASDTPITLLEAKGSFVRRLTRPKESDEGPEAAVE